MRLNNVLKFGIIIFIIGIAFSAIAYIFLDKMSSCENYNWAEFLPNSEITTTCKVVGNVGQDLTLRAIIIPNGGIEPLDIPANLQISDPRGNILYDTDFEGKVIISFKPELFGNYIATITSLEDANNRIYCCLSNVIYAFGFLTGYDDVNNPLGMTFVWLAPIGNVFYLLGITNCALMPIYHKK